MCTDEASLSIRKLTPSQQSEEFDSDDDVFIDITETDDESSRKLQEELDRESKPTEEAPEVAEGEEKVKKEQSPDSPTRRKPTRPLPVVTPKGKGKGKKSTLPQKAPQLVQLPTATTQTMKRRRLELAPSVLAQRVIENPTKSSIELAEELTQKYSMTPTEQRDRVNVIRGMRAMASAFSTRIRRRLPLDRTDADIKNFLHTVEEECQLMEGHQSDEFAN